MKKVSLSIITLFSALVGSGSLAAREVRFGVEVDAVPFILGGYYASASAAIDNWQLRFVTTEFETPVFYLQSGYEDNEVDVNAVILDYYFDSSLQGFWVGGGYERWDGEVVRSSTQIKKEYSANLFTMGGGYAWYFTDHFYLNPWAGIHIPVSGDDKVTFSDGSFDIKPSAEVSVKLGIKF